MTIIFSIISIWAFIKTLSYGIYELQQKNKSGGFSVIILAIITLILSNAVFWLR